MMLKCCKEEIMVSAVKFYPVEELDDLEEPKKDVKYCPFCGKAIDA